jgi:hypothetical protein
MRSIKESESARRPLNLNFGENHLVEFEREEEQKEEMTSANKKKPLTMRTFRARGKNQGNIAESQDQQREEVKEQFTLDLIYKEIFPLAEKIIKNAFIPNMKQFPYFLEFGFTNCSRAFRHYKDDEIYIIVVNIVDNPFKNVEDLPMGMEIPSLTDKPLVSEPDLVRQNMDKNYFYRGNDLKNFKSFLVVRVFTAEDFNSKVVKNISEHVYEFLISETLRVFGINFQKIMTKLTLNDLEFIECRPKKIVISHLFTNQLGCKI